MSGSQREPLIKFVSVEKSTRAIGDGSLRGASDQVVDRLECVYYAIGQV